MTDDHHGLFDGELGSDPRRRTSGRAGRSGPGRQPRAPDGDHLDEDDDPVDLDALRAALRTTADSPQAAGHRSVRAGAARDRHRLAREAARRRDRRRRRSVVIALLVLALISTSVVIGFIWWRHSQQPEVRDYAGSGDTEVVVRIQSGDGLTAIAETLAGADVVASAQAFVDTATPDADVAALHQGFYKVRQHSSASAAANQLVDDANHVGQLRLIPGRQLADVTGGSAVVSGYLTDIVKAACVPLNGATRCSTVQQLQEAARTVPAVELGVVDWALTAVDRAPEADKRLEGLILPGDYDVQPGADAKTLLRSVISASAARWNASDIISRAADEHLTPYQVTTIASVVEREGITADMPKVARVIFNRLAKKTPWQMDSTVNYALNRAQIATSDADRHNKSPYNTYLVAGMPPTPISAPGPDAIDAALEPATGSWLFFVKVDKSGRSCFSNTEAEHLVCVDKARAAGVFDG